MHRTWRTLLPLVILVLLVGYLYSQSHRRITVNLPTTPIATPSAPESSAAAPSLAAFLPPQAIHTLALIASNGPFPHAQDGVVFGNYEHRLPAEPRGYYHEYTVETPGARDRGARRIITGGNPPVVYYYTDDHYRSFREFKAPR
ncbi:MAG: Guanyl-specific ribonuclease [Rhodanobacteraceae bacterium]|jgi:guanyl-specific ribonuclease Sa|nr:MAG: Guanyl-specific ribonuclease [Rhodanobacteraceae bacterium]